MQTYVTNRCAANNDLVKFQAKVQSEVRFARRGVAQLTPPGHQVVMVFLVPRIRVIKDPHAFFHSEYVSLASIHANDERAKMFWSGVILVCCPKARLHADSTC